MPRPALATARVLAAAIAAALAVYCAAAMAENYPARPIRLIVPTAAGGGYDITGRLLAEKLALELGQPVVVENRAGAGTLLGTQAAATAPADGYTLLVGGLANIAFNPGLYEKLPYKPSDLAPVALAGSFSYALIARKDLAQGDLRQLIDFARAHPGKLSIATAGAGTGQHVAAALLKSVAGIDLLEVPYKGAQPVYTDLIGGRVDLFFDNSATVRPFVESDRVRALVVSSAERDPLLPAVASGREAGLDRLVLESWIGIFAPAKTPQPAVDRLRGAMDKVMQSPDFRKRLSGYGVRPLSLTPAQTEQLVKADLQKWPDFLRRAGIKAE